jgi:ATP-dependent Lhr-like helicase
VERDFKEGKLKILVSTSSMELGIDIGRVDRVVQVMSPRRAINLSQRIGRSGHLIGLTSKGYIITVSNIFELLESLVIARRTRKGDLEDLPSYEKPLDALAHSLAGSVLDSKPLNINEFYASVTQLLFYRSLTLDELDELASFMDDLRIIKKKDGIIDIGRRTRSYFYTVSMIPSEPDYIVVDIATRKIVGKVSERFVVTNISKDSPYFVLAGKIWKVLDIDTEKGKIQVLLQGETEARIPSWEGELIPVDYKVAREVCGILQLLLYDRDYALQIIDKRYGDFLTDRAKRDLYQLTENISKDSYHLNLGLYRPLLEIIDDGVILYSCLGSKGNYTLGLLVSSIISRLEHVEYSRIPYAILFTSNISPRVLAKMIVDALIELSKTDKAGLMGLFIEHVRNTYAYRIRLSWIAKRMGIIGSEARLTSETLRKLAQIYRDTVVEREVINEMLVENNDMDSVIDFLSNLKVSYESIIDRWRRKPTPLALQVLDNPYMRKPETASGRLTVLKSIMIDAVKKRLSNTEARLICMSCGYSWKTRPAEVTPSKYLKCPRCGGTLITVTWKGDEEAIEVVKKYIKRKKLSPKEKKRLSDLHSVASLLLSYTSEGLNRYVIEALMARGIGPKTLPRILGRLVDYGEREFYRSIIDEERKYVENRKYWKT